LLLTCEKLQIEVSTSSKKDDVKVEKNSGKSEKAIMKRLGGYIGENRASSWAKDQVSNINIFLHFFL
jgi:hypothetical protein